MILSDLSPRGTLHGEIFRGGGGGVSDYDDLTNRPKINNITLTGNKTAQDLGLADPSDIKFTGINEAAGWSIYRCRNITVEGLVYDVAYPEFTGTDGVDPGTNGLVKCPEPTDYGKFLAASGGWETPTSPPPTLRNLLYTLDTGATWRSIPTPNNTEIIIIETQGGYGVRDRTEVNYTKIPSRSGGDNYITALSIPYAQGQKINIATNDDIDTIYISTDAIYDTTNMYVKVYAKLADY